MILVTGATGSNGTEIVKRLTAQNVQVRAMVRNRDRAKEVALPNIAEVAVVALTETGHEGKIYNLTGPQALTHAEMAEQLSAALNRQIAFVDIPSEAMRDQLLNIGVPAWQADGLIEDYAHYRRNEAAVVSSGVQDAIGKEPRSFKTFACDYATMFG